ncbi:MAG: hypothetical protein H0X34_10445 [Chthoniobacterales bacterium]|nr:hypothetical protein [Chthoniobacterales bacterium]
MSAIAPNLRQRIIIFIFIAAGIFAGSSFAQRAPDVRIRWTPTGPMQPSVYSHTANLLENGMVLVAGGNDLFNVISTAQLFDPATAQWSDTGSLSIGRDYHTGTLLPDGRVLVAGDLLRRRLISPPPKFITRRRVFGA